MEAVVNDLRKERIIFAVDLDSSMEESFFSGDKKQEMRISKTKQLIKQFVEQKAAWNDQHEFALMILGQKAVWHVDFTREVNLFKMAIDELYAMGTYSSFDSTSLFEEALKHGMLSVNDGYVLRMILIYTRSNVLPSKPREDVMTELHAVGKFHFDCIYIHNRSSEVRGEVKPQMIYDRLTEMEDPQVPGYFFETTRLVRKYAAAMTQLLANPTQRACQDLVLEFDYVLPKPPSVREQDERLKRREQEDKVQTMKERPMAMRTNTSPSTIPPSASTSITGASRAASPAIPSGMTPQTTAVSLDSSSSPVIGGPTRPTPSRLGSQQQIIIPDDESTSPKPGSVIRL